MSVFADHVEAHPTTAATPDTRVIARFTIPGNPVPKGRPRMTRQGHTYTPQRTVIAEQSVLAAFKTVFPKWEPVEFYVELDVSFFRADKRVVDCDNMGKLVQDALNKHAFKDDGQVVDLLTHKWFTTKARARTDVVISMVLGDRIEDAT